MVKGGHPMIGASKILTVSYGTFSCTLEGFDDPFNTMRAIAEYFRDLAAEDRYFGAEPPTPDAAMLLKIAEREVQRRVEAKISENGVVLRTGDAVQAPSYRPETRVEPRPEPTQIAPESAPEPVFQSAPEPSPMPDGVAAKLLRIRAAVANAERVEPVAPAPVAPAAVAAHQPILADYSEDQHADDIGTSATLTAAFAPDVFPSDVIDADVWEMPTADLPVAAPQADENTAPEQTTPATSPFTDDYFAALPQDADEDIGNPKAADIDPEVAVELMADDTDESGDYDISSEDMSDLRALDGDAAPTPAAIEMDSALLSKLGLDYDQDYEIEDDAQPAIAADDAIEAELEYDAPDNTSDDAPASIDPVIEEIDSVYDAPETDPAPRPSDKALRARARVIKVRRDDAIETPADPSAAPVADAESGVAALLAAEANNEADLRRELRAVQQQTAAETPADPDAETDDTGAEDDARQRLDTAGEAAVSRLIEQTNEAMAVPENRRRLSAIAHLKAAVAATVADRFAKGGTPPKEAETKRLDPYRDDLARVVRPQHPTGNEDAPVTPRPAPLVLVSAQRIDRPRTPATDGNAPTLTSVPTAPIRPRRITSAALAVDTAADLDDEDDVDANAFTDTRGFAEFSEKLGANSLAEILEAAAAYSVCVEGRPYFSRPQLMNQIGALSADSEYTREDGLRTFGALLRDGRIQKIKRGQFVLTESSRYLTEARNLSA